MTPRDFAYWLQGYFEIQDPKEISVEQIECIKEHLQLVFKKETTDRGNPIGFRSPYDNGGFGQTGMISCSYKVTC